MRFPLSLALLCASPLHAGDPGAPPLFRHEVYDVPSPVDLTVGDWNGDGLCDVALGALGGDIPILLAGEFGQLVRVEDVPTVAQVRGLDHGDLDGDGWLDLLFIDGTSLTALRGLGDGTFEEFGSWPLSSGPTDLVVADLNGDGAIDVATVNEAPPSIGVLQGVLGGFLPPIELPLFSTPVALDYGDLDGNGLDDLVAVTDVGWVVRVLAQSHSFDVSVPHTLGEELHSVAVGDLNADGWPDVVTAGTEVYVFDGVGGGELDVPSTIDEEMALANFFNIVQARRVVVADLDGLAGEDLFVGHGALFDRGAVLLGQPDGLVAVDEFLFEGSVPWLAAGEVDGDGGVDLFAGASQMLEVIHRRDNGRWTGTSLAGLLGRTLEAVDLDADSDAELLNFDEDSPFTELRVFDRSEGLSGEISYQEVYTASVPGKIRTHALADFDLDGDIDLVGVVQEGTSFSLRRLLGAGDGTFAPVEFLTDLDWYVPDLRSIDLEGDGRPDLAGVVDGLPQIALFQNLGDATFATPTMVGTSAGAKRLAIGDVNADGWDDIFVDASTPGRLFARLGLGHAEFGPAFSVGGEGSMNGPLLTDFDGDGHLDCIAATGGNVAYGVGDGSFEAGIPTPSAPEDYDEVFVGDLDGDGLEDVIYLAGTIGSQVVFSSKERTPKAAAYPEPGADAVFALALDDVDGDGRSDLLRGIGVSYSSPFGSLKADLNRAPDPAGLYAEGDAISLSAGGTQFLSLCAGKGYAEASYFVLGSISGTTPGLDFGGVNLPLNPDAYWLLTLLSPEGTYLVNSFGFLDAQGEAQAAVSFPAGTDPALAVLDLWHAYLLVDFALASVSYASAAVPLELID